MECDNPPWMLCLKKLQYVSLKEEETRWTLSSYAIAKPTVCWGDSDFFFFFFEGEVRYERHIFFKDEKVKTNLLENTNLLLS